MYNDLENDCIASLNPKDTGIAMKYQDLIALIEAGLLKITELDEFGRIKKFDITQAGYDYYDNELKDESRPTL